MITITINNIITIIIITIMITINDNNNFYIINNYIYNYIT